MAQTPEGSIQTKLLKSGERIFYSLTKKQSQNKLGFNVRLLVVVEEKYFGYIRQKDFNKKDIENSIDLSKIKKRIPLKDIRRIMNINKTVSITINDFDKNNKLVSLKWVFEMQNVKLAQSWTQILDKQNSPFPSRKTTQHKQKDNDFNHQKLPNSPSIKQYVKLAENTIKQMQKKQQPPSPISVNINEKPKQKQLITQNKLIQNEQKQSKLIPLNSNLLNVKKPEDGKRQSQLTFSFKGYPDNQEEQQLFSPPKKQQKIQTPHPVLQKLKTIQSNLSSHLDQKIDYKVVEKEIAEHKENKLSKSIENKRNLGMKKFKKLSQNLTNRQKQIQQINFINYFRQPIGEIDDQKYVNFYSFCQLKMQQLAGLDSISTEFRQWASYVRQMNNVLVQVIQTQIKQIPGNNYVCDEGLLKSYLNKQKNSNYIWKIISKHEKLSQVFLLPMTCLAEHKGILLYFSCMHSDQIQNQPTNKFKDSSKYFQTLSEVLNINRSVLQNSTYIKFKRFDNGQKFVITEVNQLLPRLISKNCLIRSQMFQQVFHQIQSQNGYQNKTNKKEQEQQLKYFRHPIQCSIQAISKNLQRLQEYVIHPSQFGQLIHTYGLNIVHTQQIYKKIQNLFMKSILKTQVIVRSFKVVYRKRLQQTLISKQNKQTNNSIDDSVMINMAKSLINLFFGKRQQSKKLWDIVNLQCQINFKLSVEKNQVNKGYLFLGVSHHLGINLQSIYSSCDKIFMVDNFVNEIQFLVKMKPCKLYWINQSIYSAPVHEAANILMDSLNLKVRKVPYYIFQDKQTLQKIYQILSLCYSPSSPQIKNLQIYKQSKQSCDKTLYYFRRKVAEIKWQIKYQSELTSSLPAQSLKNVKQKIQKLKEQLAYYFGQYHPFYAQFYDLLISLSEKSNNFNEMEQFSKLSMANMIQLCGGNTMHLKLANNYYQKGEMYHNWGKTAQAIDNYKKAKNILEFNQYTQTKQYAVVQLRLGELYLNNNRDNQCWNNLVSCFTTFSNLLGIQIQLNSHKNNFLQKKINDSQNSKAFEIESLAQEQRQQIYKNMICCLQLLNRCSGSIPDKSLTILSYTLLILENTLDSEHTLQAIQLPDAQFLQLLKLFTQNYFIHNRKQITQQFFTYAQRICDEGHNIGNTNINTKVSSSLFRNGDQISAIKFLKQLIINAILVEVLNDFNNKSKIRLQQIVGSRKTTFLNKQQATKQQQKSKDLENFQKLIRALIVTLGQGFVLGVLNDQHP